MKKLIIAAITIIGLNLLPARITNMDAAPTKTEQAVAKAVAENKAVVVMFQRPSCPFCQFIMPKFYGLTGKPQNQDVKFIDVNISSEGPHFKQSYRFSTVPTVIYFKDGKEIARHGSDNRQMSAARMQQFIDKLR